MIDKEHDSISVLVLSIYDNAAPAIIAQQTKPNKYVNHAWIPQTLGDCVWVAYEFASLEERLEWEKALPEFVAKKLSRHLIPSVLKLGWKVRDHNGFAVRGEKDD